jgi:glutathione S-transferase
MEELARVAFDAAFERDVGAREFLHRGVRAFLAGDGDEFGGHLFARRIDVGWCAFYRGKRPTPQGTSPVSKLIVHHLAGAWGLPSVSPFCLKLDAYLRLADLPHEAVIDATPFGAPKRKAPWIEHEGMKLGDSGFIIDYLKARFGKDPDAHLSASDRAVALALRRLIEENLYWTMVYDRWMVDENWAVFKNVVLGGVSPVMRQMIGPVARRGVRKQLKGHGIGIHSNDEIHAIGRRDIGALSDFLGSKPFFMGEKPTEIDAIAYGQLANILNAPIESPVKDEGKARRNLVDFVERFRSRYY